MIKFDDYRKDKSYKLDSLSYQEIFNGLKDVVVEIVSDLEKENYFDGLVRLNAHRCDCKMAFGADRDMYPKVKLDVGGKYFLILNTYEVKLLVVESEIKEIKSDRLDNALIEFMSERFPESDYVEKRKKYFEDADLVRRISCMW